MSRSRMRSELIAATSNVKRSSGMGLPGGLGNLVSLRRSVDGGLGISARDSVPFRDSCIKPVETTHCVRGRASRKIGSPHTTKNGYGEMKRRAADKGSRTYGASVQADPKQPNDSPGRQSSASGRFDVSLLASIATSATPAAPTRYHAGASLFPVAPISHVATNGAVPPNSAFAALKQKAKPL